MAKFNASEFSRKLREAQRKAERQINQEIDRVNRANKKAVDDYNRQANAHNQREINRFNNQIKSYNNKVNTHNRKLIADINRQLRTPSSSVRYTESERILADRVYKAVTSLDSREYDTFLSYARIDGSEVAQELREALENLGVSVWFDEVAIIPGHSQSLQMDAGLRKSRSGIALLTPAYLAGRFWTERELGALLGKETLIPVLHKVTFDDVKLYSGILPDLAGFTTSQDTIIDIADKIASAVIVEHEE